MQSLLSTQVNSVSGLHSGSRGAELEVLKLEEDVVEEKGASVGPTVVRFTDEHPISSVRS